MNNSTYYDKDSIQSLTPKEHIQTRPSMYIGSTETPKGIITEILDNSLDEVGVGHADYIIVDIDSNGVVTIQDNGQGILANTKREDGLTILEAAYGQVNTSAKFSDDGVYSGRSKGLHGVGSSITVFLSDWLEVETYNNGQSEFIRFEDGEIVKRNSGTTTITGVKTSFKPSKKYFSTDKIDLKEFEQYLHNICGLMPQLIIKFNGQEIQHKEGIEYLVKQQLNKDFDLLENNHFVINKEINDKSLSLVMTYTTKSTSYIKGFVNYGDTQAGPHYTAIKSCLTRCINKWAKEQGLLKIKDKNLDGNSIQEGIIIIFNLNSPGIAYDSQSKERVSSNEFVPFLNEVMTTELDLFMDNNPSQMTQVIEKALLARKASEAAKKARAAVKNKDTKQKKEKVFKLPTTLIDCWTKDREKAELLICEGKSAASGLVAARDSEFQAVYGVRGKMLSVLKTTPKKILANQEINNLIQALGLECDQTTAKLKYDKNKLRYGKIIACADADPDGVLIENLLFNILWYLCPDLIINGHVYSAIPPLYRITTSANEYIYLANDKELNEYKANNADKKFQISRNKGLGEQDSNELAECLLEPATRNIVQLVVEDIGKTDKIFDDLYGKKVEPRLKFLLEHSEEANID